MRKMIWIAVAFMASPAAAQSTTCFRSGQMINCNTQQQPQMQGPIDYYGMMGGRDGLINPGRAMAEGQARKNALRLQQLQIEEAQQRLNAERQRQQAERASQTASISPDRDAYARQAAGLIKDGHCDAALDLLLSQDFYDMAGVALKFCRSAKP